MGLKGAGDSMWKEQDSTGNSGGDSGEEERKQKERAKSQKSVLETL